VSNLLADPPHNADELAQYRSLSTLAIAALVLGLFSPLAFLGPLGIAVPLVAIAVALLALAHIKAARDSLTGRPLALAAIALAVVFAAAALSRAYVRDTLSIRIVAEPARRWMELLSTGRIDDALDVLTPDVLMKLQPSVPPDAEPPPFDRAKAVELLAADPLVHALEPAQPSKPVAFQFRDQRYFWGDRSPQVGYLFTATGGQADQVEGNLVFSRGVTPGGHVVWLVKSWGMTKPDPQEFRARHRHVQHR
jgi:hypothetical protein